MYIKYYANTNHCIQKQLQHMNSLDKITTQWYIFKNAKKPIL